MRKNLFTNYKQGIQVPLSRTRSCKSSDSALFWIKPNQSGFLASGNLASFIRTSDAHRCWELSIRTCADEMGEAMKCRWRSLLTVTCKKHFNSCRWNEPFQEVHYGVYRPTRRIGDDCSIVAVSYCEQGIHPLSEQRLLSHLTNEIPIPPPPHHQ